MGPGARIVRGVTTIEDVEDGRSGNGGPGDISSGRLGFHPRSSIFHRRSAERRPLVHILFYDLAREYLQIVRRQARPQWFYPRSQRGRDHGHHRLFRYRQERRDQTHRRLAGARQRHRFRRRTRSSQTPPPAALRTSFADRLRVPVLGALRLADPSTRTSRWAS